MNRNTKFLLILGLILTIFALSLRLFFSVNYTKDVNKQVNKVEYNVKVEINNKIPKDIIFNIKGTEKIEKLTDEQAENLKTEIEKLLNSGTDKAYESKFDSEFTFGEYKVLFNINDIKNREENNRQTQETMDADVKEHRNNGVAEEIIEKKFGKDGSKIRTTATVGLNINGKGYSVFNDEKIVELLVEIIK